MTTRLDRILAWTMLSAQSLIILTGALVRLTGSGLGCPTWPRCTPESIVPYGALTMHSAIEFGNRLLGVGLGILGVVTILVLLRRFRTRPDLVWFALALTAVVPVQAVLGGITVLTGLNPWIVALHFVPSAAAVIVSTLFVRRTYDSGGRPKAIGTPLQRGLAWTALALTTLVVILGLLVTGAGPHAGDEMSARNGFDTLLVARLHAAPVWALVAVTIGSVLVSHAAVRRGAPGARSLRRAALVFTAVVAAQGALGYVQYFLGVPWVLVAIHIIGVCAVLIAATWLLDSHYARPPQTAVLDEEQGEERDADRTAEGDSAATSA